jgi:hypothetical protein
VFFAFAAVVIEALKENYESDNINDEPHQQVGRFVVQLTIMIAVLLFVATPMIAIDSLKLRVPTRQCEILPSVTSEDLLLTQSEWLKLNQFGAKSLVNELIEKEVSNSSRRVSRDTAATNVANRILTSSLLSEYRRLTTSNGYVTQMPKRMVLENVVAQSVMNKRQRGAVEDIGLTLEGVGMTIRVPLWWQFWRNYMLGINASIHAMIPCDSGVRLAKERMDTEFIDDSELKSDFLDFYSQCHTPSLTKWRGDQEINRRGLSSGTQQNISEVAVPGNSIFLDNYYPNISSTIPVKGFGDVSGEGGYLGDADAPDSANPAVPLGTGYPDCDQWWLKPYDGIEERLISYFEYDTNEGIETAQKVFGLTENDPSALLQKTLAHKMHSGNSASVAAAKAVMKQVSGAYLPSHEQTIESSSLGGQLMGLAVDFGILTTYVERLTGLKALLRAMPMATALLLMFFTAVLPIGLVVGRFSLGPTLGLTMSYVSIYLWFPYFRMVKWVDDNLVSIFSLSAFSADKMMIDIMIGAAYIAVPMLITGAITMAGIRISSFDPLGGASMGSIGQGGAKSLTNLGKMVGTKGLKAGK